MTFRRGRTTVAHILCEKRIQKCIQKYSFRTESEYSSIRTIQYEMRRPELRAEPSYAAT